MVVHVGSQTEVKWSGHMGAGHQASQCKGTGIAGCVFVGVCHVECVFNVCTCVCEPTAVQDIVCIYVWMCMCVHAGMFIYLRCLLLFSNTNLAGTGAENTQYIFFL
ncbi:unnamed protein product [Arctogadus glacialis]